MEILVNNVLPAIILVFLIVLLGYMIGRKTDYDLSFAGPSKADPINIYQNRKLQTFAPNLNVLVVDDNPVNQLVAQEMLETRNIHVGLASNGLECLEVLKRKSYDLVLLDIQMPEMDGYEVARAINDREKSDNWKRPGIVALIADAMFGDRKKCFDAGMDDYLSKPFTSEQLDRVLRRWLHNNRPDEGEKTLQNPVCDAPAQGQEREDSSIIDQKILDRIRALQRPDRPNILTKLIGTFLKNSSALMEELRGAVRTDSDAEVIRQVAHSLKSGCANVGAMALSDLLRALEEVGRFGELDKAPRLFDDVEILYGQVREALNKELEKVA